MERVLLCRFGELFLKCGNRRLFERALAGNIRAALADVPSARVQPAHGRVLVRVPAADADDAAARLERVFGLVSFSIARQVPATGESMPPESNRRALPEGPTGSPPGAGMAPA